MRKILLTLAAVLLSTAAAQADLIVSSRPLPHGIQLDAGSGPKDFLCVKGRVTHQVKLAGRTVNTGGKFLTLTFDLADQHLSMEAHDQQRPLQTNQVRLTCNTRDDIQVKVGSSIEVTEPDE